MNDESTTSLVPVNDVAAAATRLSELSERMRSTSFGFKETDISHIDNIIDALQELDIQKTKAKDTLETESIKCAAVRHRLMHYPDEINRDIHEAVLASRIGNEEVIGRIKTQLGQLSEEVAQSERQAASVDDEVNSLRPQLVGLKADFESSFARLNDLLAEKATQQIRLNEDREAVRGANARIVELAEDTADLAGAMAAEREAHGNTMRGLLEETDLVSQQLRGHTAKEDEKRREFFAIRSLLAESTCELDEATQLNEALEHDNVVLEVQQQDMMRQQQLQQKSREEMKSNIQILTAESRSIAEEHQAQMLQLRKTVEELDAKTQEQAVMKETAIAKKLEIEDRTQKLQVKEEAQKTVQDVSNALQQAKLDLQARTADLGRMREEIFDMESRTAELGDAERAEKEGWLNPAELLEGNSVLAYNQHIGELKEKAEHERHKRMSVQAESEKLQATIKEFLAREAATEKEINGQIDSLKREKLSLEDEHNGLHARIKADEERRTDLTQRVATGRQQLADARDRGEAEAERLQRETEHLREEQAARAAELAALAPKFADFQAFYARGTADYEALKRSLVALKGRRAGLEESSRRAGQEVGRLAAEIDRLRRDKERRVAQSTRQLEVMAGDRLGTEREIYALGCKVDTVTRENARLTAGVDRLEREMRSMRDTWEWAVPFKARLDQQRTQETQRLQAGRQSDAALQAEFQENDHRLLAVLAIIIGDTDARRAIVEAVTGNLEAELGYLDDFLKTSNEPGK